MWALFIFNLSMMFFDVILIASGHGGTGIAIGLIFSTIAALLAAFAISEGV
jgi:hypothetical protein